MWRQKSKRGYGKLTYNYKTIDVHRAAASVWLELDLTSPKLVLHKCSNKNCFNPEHLYLGSQSDNIRDSVKDKTHYKARKSACVNGHAYTIDNTYWYKHNGWKARYCKVCMRRKSKENYKRRKQFDDSRSN